MVWQISTGSKSLLSGGVPDRLSATNNSYTGTLVWCRPQKGSHFNSITSKNPPSRKWILVVRLTATELRWLVEAENRAKREWLLALCWADDQKHDYKRNHWMCKLVTVKKLVKTRCYISVVFPCLILLPPWKSVNADLRHSLKKGTCTATNIFFRGQRNLKLYWVKAAEWKQKETIQLHQNRMQSASECIQGPCTQSSTQGLPWPPAISEEPHSLKRLSSHTEMKKAFEWNSLRDGGPRWCTCWSSLNRNSSQRLLVECQSRVGKTCHQNLSFSEAVNLFNPPFIHSFIHNSAKGGLKITSAAEFEHKTFSYSRVTGTWCTKW